MSCTSARSTTPPNDPSPAVFRVNCKKHPRHLPGMFLRVDKPLPCVQSFRLAGGELEGAKPASNQIKCRAKPCSARRAWSEASIFVPLRGTKIPALFHCHREHSRSVYAVGSSTGSPAISSA